MRAAIKKPSGPIRRVHIDRLTRLEAKGLEIADLTNIHLLKNLTHLDLTDNRIRDIGPLVYLTKLTWVDASHNRIEDTAPLANLNKLARLFLSANRIKDLLPLVANAGLGYNDALDLTRNPLDCTDENTANHLAVLENRKVQLEHDCRR